MENFDKLTNNELLRAIQDKTDEHERKKSEIIKLCKHIDQIEIDYNKLMSILSDRMGNKK